jgi:hypothetical protein
MTAKFASIFWPFVVGQADEMAGYVGAQLE